MENKFKINKKMRKIVLSILVVASLLTACKGEKKEKNEKNSFIISSSSSITFNGM